MKMKKQTGSAGIYRVDGATKPKGAMRRALQQVRMFSRMVWDRSFKVAWTTKLTAFGGAAYVLMPADLIPDVIPILGLVDDVAVLGLVVTQFRQELARYRHHLTGSTVTPQAVQKSPYQRAVEEVEALDEIMARRPKPVRSAS